MRVVLCLSLALALAACGQKGPLYLPDQKPKAVVRGAPAPATPTPPAPPAPPAPPPKQPTDADDPSQP